EPALAVPPHDRPAVREVRSERALAHPALRAVRDRDRARRHGAQLVTVAVEVAPVPANRGLEEPVDVVDAAGRVHPPGALVEALVDEELPPCDRAVRV